MSNGYCGVIANMFGSMALPEALTRFGQVPIVAAQPTMLLRLRRGFATWHWIGSTHLRLELKN